MITQKYLKEILEYTFETGIFTWRVREGSNRIKAGTPVGTPTDSGYLRINLEGEMYLLHRLAWLYMYGEFPRAYVDHIDGNPANNSLLNLRACSLLENQRNRKINKNNLSGFKGVGLHKKTGKWQARAGVGGKRKHLGLFNTPEEASKVYNDFTKEHYGEFYRDTTDPV